MGDSDGRDAMHCRPLDGMDGVGWMGYSIEIEPGRPLERSVLALPKIDHSILPITRPRWNAVPHTPLKYPIIHGCPEVRSRSASRSSRLACSATDRTDPLPFSNFA